MIGCLRADNISLSLDPANGALAGPAGTTVGWGFTLANMGINYAVISGSDFCVGPISSPCSNSVGTYTDFSQFQFLVAGPSQTLMQSFDNAMMTGIGSFQIDAAASGSVLGQVVVYYDLFSMDPNSPNFDPNSAISFGNTLTAVASVTVATQPSTVPEPTSAALLLPVLVALWTTRWRLARGRA